MWKYAALISYVGTRYCGWQRQSGSAAEGDPSIQGEVEACVRKITSEPEVNVVGSGRTDAGVHASGQVIHFVLRKKEWDPRILFRAINSLLPRDVRILSLHTAPEAFHCQRGASKKQYSYYFQQGPCALPFLLPFSWWFKERLDISAMQAGVDRLVGRYDFKPFQASGSKPGSTVREVFEAQVSWESIPFPGMPLERASKDFGLIRLRLVGSGFLKQMVRGIAGTLRQVGDGTRRFDCFSQILESKDRSLVGPTAPGRGLWLEQVWYPDFEFVIRSEIN